MGWVGGVQGGGRGRVGGSIHSYRPLFTCLTILALALIAPKGYGYSIIELSDAHVFTGLYEHLTRFRVYDIIWRLHSLLLSGTHM